MPFVCTELANNKMVKLCEICGNSGVAEAIITCCDCKNSRQHLYCMRVFMQEAPTFWSCEECEQSKLLSPTETLRQHKHKASAPTISKITQKPTGVAESPNKKSFASRYKEARVDTGKTKYISCDEAVKLSSGANNPSRNAHRSVPGSQSMPQPYERAPVKPPPHDRSQQSTSPREKVVLVFRNKGNATLSTKTPASELTSIKSPTRERRTKFEPPLQQGVVQRSAAPKETVVPPLQSRGDATSSLKSPVCKKTDLQKSAVQQSAGPKVNSVLASKNGGDDAALPVNCYASSTRAKRKFNERDIAIANTEVVPPEKEETDIGRQVKVPKSSEKLKKTDTKSAKPVVVPPRKEDLDIGRHHEVPESSEKLEKTNTKSGSKNDVVEAESSDAGTPHQTSALPVSEEDNPYIPSYLSHWSGSFILPNCHEKFNDAFKAHLPSRVHYKVYETVKEMPEILSFELVPSHEIWMEIFPGYIPDSDDIGLYFFPVFKKRLENDLSIIDFLWKEKLLMKSKVKSNLEGRELLVFSSRVLQPNSQEFRGSHFLWGVLRHRKHKKVAKTPLLLEKKCEQCDDVPPGFTKIC